MRKLLLVASLVLFARTALADEVHLRGGSVIQGKAVRQGDSVIVKLESGEVRLSASEVERIESSESQEDIVQRRRAALAANDIEGRLALAAYCREHDLRATERALLLEVVDRVPDHPRARRLLGHVKTAQGWVDGSQQRRAELEAEQSARLERARVEDAERRERTARERERAAEQAEAAARRAREDAERARTAAYADPVFLYTPVYPAQVRPRPARPQREPSWEERAPSQQRHPINGFRDPRDPRFYFPVSDPRFR